MSGVEYPPLEPILEAAPARAQQIQAYGEGEASIFTVAATIGLGFARIHHPFVDGNKLAAFYAAFATLWQNGWRLYVADQDAAEMIKRGAPRDVAEEEFAR